MVNKGPVQRGGGVTGCGGRGVGCRRLEIGAADERGTGRARAEQVGLDIGGTFIGRLLVNEAGGAFHVGKTLTTPGDPSLAVEQGLVELLAQAGVRGDEVGTA